MKIWHQSLTSIENVPQYRDAVIQHIQKVARPDVEVVIHGMSKETYPAEYPGHFITYAYLQNLHSEQFIRNALIAESAGYDCMFIGTIPDVGLLEARTLVDIPVIGYGQASFHFASMLGDMHWDCQFFRAIKRSAKTKYSTLWFGRKVRSYRPNRCRFL